MSSTRLSDVALTDVSKYLAEMTTEPGLRTRWPLSHALDPWILGPAGHMVNESVEGTLEGRIPFQGKQPWAGGLRGQEGF